MSKVFEEIWIGGFEMVREPSSYAVSPSSDDEGADNKVSFTIWKNVTPLHCNWSGNRAASADEDEHADSETDTSIVKLFESIKRTWELLESPQSAIPSTATTNTTTPLSATHRGLFNSIDKTFCWILSIGGVAVVVALLQFNCGAGSRIHMLVVLRPSIEMLFLTTSMRTAPSSATMGLCVVKKVEETCVEEFTNGWWLRDSL